VEKILSLLKKTTTTPYHPQSNSLVEVVTKTIAQFLKTQVGTNPIIRELYLAPIATLTLQNN
jgi:hypothetical protein